MLFSASWEQRQSLVCFKLVALRSGMLTNGNWVTTWIYQASVQTCVYHVQHPCAHTHHGLWVLQQHLGCRHKLVARPQDLVHLGAAGRAPSHGCHRLHNGSWAGQCSRVQHMSGHSRLRSCWNEYKWVVRVWVGVGVGLQRYKAYSAIHVLGCNMQKWCPADSLISGSSWVTGWPESILWTRQH